MENDDRQKWNVRYNSNCDFTHSAAEILTENMHLLPESGRALDLACGTGTNAILLARHGLITHAWDISDVAISKLKSRAEQEGLGLLLEQRNIIDHPPPIESFDVIVVSHFLDRSIIPHLIQALSSKGLLFYQTFTQARLNNIGPSNPGYLLERNELLRLFKDLTIIVYREDDLVGDLESGLRNEAMLIAQKI